MEQLSFDLYTEPEQRSDEWWNGLKCCTGHPHSGRPPHDTRRFNFPSRPTHPASDGLYSRCRECHKHAIRHLRDKREAAGLPRDWSRTPKSAFKALYPNAKTEEWDRMTVFEKDGGVCYLCGQYILIPNFEPDHVVPTSKGGDDTYDNLRAAHQTCNCAKKDLTLDEFKQTGSWIRLHKPDYDPDEGYRPK